MNIILIGYGRMGRALEEEATRRGHTIKAVIGRDDLEELPALKGADTAAIEFTTPESGYGNVMACINAGLPVVSGTTGWNDRLEEARQHCRSKKGAFLHASNFSIGVNFLFEVARQAGRLLQNQPELKAMLTEVHHIHKKDRPSGTALSLAQAFMSGQTRYKGHTVESNPLALDPDSLPFDQLPILSEREGEVFGIHSLLLLSDLEELSFTHTAHSRALFASGAIAAAEWLNGKTGSFTMRDVLGMNDE